MYITQTFSLVEMNIINLDTVYSIDSCR